jgi:molybdenum cofactor cytidylyltransferase
MLAVAILAAGESRRMGTPKALLYFHGKTFVEHLISVTRSPRVGVTRIVLGADAADIQTKLQLDPSSIVLNENWRQGQLSSIQAAIRSLPAGATEGLILCPVDQPLISDELVTQLIVRFYSSGKEIVLPTHKGRRGHPVIFRVSLYEELLEASTEIGARQVVWAHPQGVEELPTDEEGVVWNLNDPQTLKKVLDPEG